jgi:hypothetical protein
VPEPLLDRSDIDTVLRVKAGERLPHPMEDRLTAHGVLCATLSGLIYTFTTIDTRAESQPLYGSQVMTIRFPVLTWEDQSCCRVPLPPFPEPLY